MAVKFPLYRTFLVVLALWTAVSCQTLPPETSPEVQRQLEAYATSVSQLESELQNLQTALAEQIAANQTQQSEVLRVTDQLEKLQSDLSAAQAVLKEFASYYPEGPQQIESQLQQLELFKQRAANLGQEGQTVQTELANALQRIAQLEDVLADLTQMGLLTISQVKEIGEQKLVTPDTTAAVEIVPSLYAYTNVDEILPLMRNDRTGRSFFSDENVFKESSPRQRSDYYYDNRSNYSMAPAIYLEISQAGTQPPRISLFVQANSAALPLGADKLYWIGPDGQRLALENPLEVQRERDNEGHLDRFEFALKGSITATLNQIMSNEGGFLYFTGSGGNLRYPVSLESRQALVNMLRVYQDLGGRF